jgi:SAM-dependent methyltransferase
VHGPKTLVTGLDRNAGLLGVARRRANPGVANVRRVEADLVALDLPEASFDAVRTERAPHALAHGYLERALDALDRVVRPGGGLALFELDYGATILALGGAGRAVVDRAADTLRRSLPQPLAGRRLPEMLSARGLSDVTAEPFSFTVGEPDAADRARHGGSLRACGPEPHGVASRAGFCRRARRVRRRVHGRAHLGNQGRRLTVSGPRCPQAAQLAAVARGYSSETIVLTLAVTPSVTSTTTT